MMAALKHTVWWAPQWLWALGFLDLRYVKSSMVVEGRSYKAEECASMG